MRQIPESNSLNELPTRKSIYEAITKCPGIHFRELQRVTKIATGNLEHHLIYLEKNNLIETQRGLGLKRYFPIGLTDLDKTLLGALRQGMLRKLIVLLLEKQQTLQTLSTKTGLSPSTTTWYLKRLEQIGVLHIEKIISKSQYTLLHREQLLRLLVVYQESFLDKLVDRFIELWER